eukprot:2732684-Prymnesium_polylepis.1
MMHENLRGATRATAGGGGGGGGGWTRARDELVPSGRRCPAGRALRLPSPHGRSAPELLRRVRAITKHRARASARAGRAPAQPVFARADGAQVAAVARVARELGVRRAAHVAAGAVARRRARLAVLLVLAAVELRLLAVRLRPSRRAHGPRESHRAVHVAPASPGGRTHVAAARRAAHLVVLHDAVAQLRERRREASLARGVRGAREALDGIEPSHKDLVVEAL